MLPSGALFQCPHVTVFDHSAKEAHFRISSFLACWFPCLPLFCHEVKDHTCLLHGCAPKVIEELSLA